MAEIDWTRHRSLAVLADLLPTTPPPEPASFDPAGEWTATWTVVLVVPDPGGQTAKASKQGWLKLHRRPAEGGVELEVDQGIVHAGRISVTTASLRCTADELATPVSWRLDNYHWFLAGGQGKVPDTELPTIRGEVRDGELVQRVGESSPPRRWRAPERFTCGWCLPDVVQRLGERTAALFDLFEEMDHHKPGHRLTRRDPVTLEWAGKSTRLHGIDQIGHGLLPYTWWLDDSGRVLIASGAQRAYLWDPGAGRQDPR